MTKQQTTKTTTPKGVKTIVRSSAAKASGGAKGHRPRSKASPASKAWDSIHKRLKSDPKFAKQFHAKASAGSSKAWVTIGKLRALAFKAAAAGKGRPKQDVNGYFVTDKQWATAVAKAKEARASK